CGPARRSPPITGSRTWCDPCPSPERQPGLRWSLPGGAGETGRSTPPPGRRTGPSPWSAAIGPAGSGEPSRVADLLVVPGGPVDQLCDDRVEAIARRSERVLDPRRHLGVCRAAHESVLGELTEC